MGGFGGPGAMNATVLAVALLATTGSLMCASTILMFLRDLRVHIPWNRDPQSTILKIKIMNILRKNTIFKKKIFLKNLGKKPKLFDKKK